MSPGGELKKDPVCGTYVSPDASVTKRIDGQMIYFCSTACRDKYRVTDRPPGLSIKALPRSEVVTHPNHPRRYHIAAEPWLSREIRHIV